MSDSDDDFEKLLGAMKTRSSASQGQSRRTSERSDNVRSSETGIKSNTDAKFASDSPVTVGKSPIPSTNRVKTALYEMSKEQETQIRQLEAKIVYLQKNAEEQLQKFDEAKEKIAKLQVNIDTMHSIFEYSFSDYFLLFCFRRRN